MKAMPTDDPLFGKGTIREDGRKIHPMYLLQVKTPAESKSEWDVFKVVDTIPAEKAFRPLNEGGCPLVKAVTKFDCARCDDTIVLAWRRCQHRQRRPGRSFR